MHKYEIEIKSLLGSKEKANNLVARMKSKDPNLKVLGSHKQLNHYFVGGSLKSLYDEVQNLLDDSSRKKLNDLAQRAKDFSVRTRDADGKIILVVKATVDDTTSSNGTARLEWESILSKQQALSPHEEREGERLQINTINDLDKLVQDAGFQYQAKWSRERQEFTFSPPLQGGVSPEGGRGGKNPMITISIDKNAGYGYLAEFEMVIDDENKAEETKSLIRELMKELKTEELPQDRLARMFDYYNKNWQEYYGTDKIFNIE